MTENHKLWLARIYRRAHEAGETLPYGLREDDPRIARAIAKYAIDPEFARQDRERAAARAKIVGDGKNPDGTPTPEFTEFAELCMRQVKANMARFARGVIK